MKEQPTIVLLTDYSDASCTAFGPAIELAQRLNGRILLLHVLREYLAIPHGSPLAPPVSMLPGEHDAQLKQSWITMKETEERLGPDVTMESEIVSGPVIHDEVQRFAAANNADFIALASHGRTGFRRAVMGSVAESILRHTKIPLLIYPEKN